MIAHGGAAIHSRGAHTRGTRSKRPEPAAGRHDGATHSTRVPGTAQAVSIAPESAAIHACVSRWGRHSLSYSALQPGMRYFGQPETGILAYKSWMGQACVLGDPLAPPEAREALIAAFLKKRRSALFMQVGRETASILAAQGQLVTPVGVEGALDTAAFSLFGARKRDLRHYRNKGRAARLLVEELPDTRETRAMLWPLSLQWLRKRSLFSRELAFLARPFTAEPEPGTRIFGARTPGGWCAFTVLDPMQDHGNVTGYCVSILRHSDDAPEGACDCINLHVVEQLRAEGIHTLSLGVSPFHRLEELAQREGRGSLPVYLIFHALHRWGDPIYHFRGLSFHKSRYRAAETPVYTTVPRPLGVLPLFASAKVCGMI